MTAKNAGRLTHVAGVVWCDVHCCVHEETVDPYGYGYAVMGEKPECGPADWRKLWAGAYIERQKPKGAVPGT